MSDEAWCDDGEPWVGCATRRRLEADVERYQWALDGARIMIKTRNQEIERLRAIEEAAKVLIAEVERTADVFEWFRPMAALRRAVHGWKEGE